MTGAVLDSSAVLALLRNEHGAAQVKSFLPGAVMSAVNVAEVVTKLIDAGMDEDAIQVALAIIGAAIEPCERERAIAIGKMRPGTRTRGLSLGDRACLALARELGVPAVTADRAWIGLDVGVNVQLVR